MDDLAPIQWTIDMCGDIKRTEHVKWVCTAPRLEHPVTPRGLSHYMVNADRLEGYE